MIKHRLILGHFTPKQQCWIAKAAAGAVLADGEIMEDRLNRLNELFNLMAPQTQADEVAKSTLMLHAPPRLEEGDFTPEQNREIYRFLLYILTASLLMGRGTVSYIHQTGRILQLPPSESSEMLQAFLLEQKTATFHQITMQLSPAVQEWLAFAITKLIFADNKIDRYEMPYFNHVQELLCNQPEKFKQAKEGALSFPHQQIPEIITNVKLKGQLFVYLANICLKPTGYIPEALQLAKDIAIAMQLPDSQVESSLKKLQHRTLLLT